MILSLNKVITRKDKWYSIMAFDKIKFKEIVNGEEITYQINDKFVTEEVYSSMLNDESLYVMPPLPKMNGSPENSCKVIDINKNRDNVDELCQCDQCQELLQVIDDIREMDDIEALEGLQNYIESIKIKSHLETASQIYNEIGNNMIKVSGKLEDQLDDFLNQFEVVEE